MQLIATRSFKYPRGSRYRTRHLTAGDPFEAESELEAELLIQGKKAKRAPQKTAGAQQSAVSDADLDRLRARAERLGIVIDKRWGVKRLQSEIEAKQR